MRSGIRTFIDDEELRRGKEIKPELRKAIQGSRMSIIVFSENYASSRWCLDELVEILECKRTNGQIVLPIFYDVEPSIVRHQSGSYAEAFENFMEDWGPWKKLLISCLPSCIIRGYWSFAKPFENNRLAEWRAALTEAANISGHDLKNEENGNEARFIEKIVRNVRPEVNLRCLNVPEYLIGVDSHVNCINMLLSIGTNDVRTIGIYGMGGIGKTTVSKDVYNKHLNHFEGSAFVENIKDVSKQPDGLLCLQKNLLNQLQKKSVMLSNSDEGISGIKNICCSRKVLILLDDLDDLNQVNQLVGHKSWLSTGSRVIMVTRDAKLLKEAQVDHIYEMKVLDEDKSLELFRRHAIGEETLFEDHISLSIDIARYCGGLPLALEVIGSHLRRENLTYWKNALKEFQSKPHKTIQDQLKISYDALSKYRKKIFLDVACFFIGWKTEYLVKFWDGCGFFAENSIRDLMDKCLLKFDENNCLWMHDLVRDMGRAIVVEESDSLLKMPSRLWIHQEVRDLLQHPKGAEAVEGIRLDLSYSQSIDLNTKAFEVMHQLRLLLIKKVDVTGSFEHLFGKLRWLSWQYCPLESLPSNFHPRELVVLDMKYSTISKLWEGVKYLNYLKILDLSRCKSLVETPNFTGVTSLERLILRDCESLSTIDPSIVLLDRLCYLDLFGCRNLKALPNNLGNIKCLLYLNLRYCKNLIDLPTSICKLRSLEELHLEGCSYLEQLPEQLGNMESLKTLNVRKTSLTELPDSIGRLSRLVHLHLYGCKELKTLPTTIGNLRSVEKLEVIDCSNLHQFPEQLGDMECLLHLNVRHCRITDLPISMSNLRSLKKLYVSGCSNLDGLPEQLGKMECLIDLNISNLKNLTNLPASICDLRALKKLYLEGCSKLERLPDELGNLECLLDLDLRKCKNLINLPTSTCNMRSLEKLDVSGCSKLERLPEELGNLKSLRTLNASNTLLEELPDSIRHLSSLVHLCLKDCKELKTLPDSICDLQSLEELNIHSCSLLRQLPDRLGNMESLRNLHAFNTRCQQLPDSIQNLKKLERLSLGFQERDPQLSAFKKFLLPFKSSLRFLRLRNCGLCDEDIPNDIVISLHSLQSLDLSGNDFCNLPSTLCQLSNLTELDLSYCKSLVSLPELPPNLQKLNVHGCTATKIIPNLQ